MKKLTGIYFVLVLCLLHFAAGAQVILDEPVKFTDTAAANRQVLGIAKPVTGSQAVNAEVIQSNYILYAQASGTDTIDLIFPVAFNTYYTGMQVYFKCTQTNTGSVHLTTGGLTPKLLKVYNAPLNPGMLQAGRMVHAVYTGTYFELVSAPFKACPDGFTAVNEKFCIENDERDSLSFYDANVICGDANARLCTWAEWYAACSATGITLQNMIGNFEWVDDAGNYGSGNVQVKVTGDISCISTWSDASLVTNKRKYRCCYNR